MMGVGDKDTISHAVATRGYFHLTGSRVVARRGARAHTSEATSPGTAMANTSQKKIGVFVCNLGYCP